MFKYALFRCYKSSKEIQKELPHLRKAAKTPGELELTLSTDLSIPGIEDIESSQKGSYKLTATYKDKSNRGTAEELG